MPGYADWRGLYFEERLALQEEGYDVSDFPCIDGGETGSEAHETAKNCDGESTEWKELYLDLWNARSRGLRDDYPYDEPTEFDRILAAAGKVPSLTAVSGSKLHDRTFGAWCGRAAGVVLGKPLEMGWSRDRIESYLRSAEAYPLNDWVPSRSDALGVETRKDCIPSTKGNVQYVQPDDDIHYTLLALRLVEKHGLDFSSRDVGTNWLDNTPYHWVWCASRQAYYKMVSIDRVLDDPDKLADIPYVLNPWRECIDGQIRSDFWGYMFPASPLGAARYAHRDCSFSLIKNGVYGGMFVAGAVAAAFDENPTVDRIIGGGLSVIPQRSRLAEMVESVRRWYDESGRDWIATCQSIESTYGHLPFAGTINNMAVVVLSLLHGGLDYTRTICTACMCGFDTDCNAGTAGSIVGAAVGRTGIPDRWVSPLNDRVQTAVTEVRDTSLSEIISRTENVREIIGCG